MNVRVENFLARGCAMIHDEIVSLGANDAQNARSNLVQRLHHRDCISLRSCLQILRMCLWNNHRVTSTHRANVEERKRRFILVHFVARNIAGNDGAEETRHNTIIFHSVR